MATTVTKGVLNSVRKARRRLRMVAWTTGRPRGLNRATLP
jgi:hypothetical protein